MDKKLKEYFTTSKTQESEYTELIGGELRRCEQTITPLCSANTRKSANKLYSSKKFLSAKELYTKALREASHDSEDESLAFGNRSAISYEVREYQVCLIDIESALSCEGCPPSLRSKLLLRKLNCYLRLNDRESAEQVLAVLKDEDTPVDTDILTKVGAMCTASLSSIPQTVKDSDEVYKSGSVAIPGASGVLNVINTPHAGRSLQAQQEIPAGSVLIRERPYAKVLIPDQWEKRCYHCIKLLTPNITVFCRKRCKVNFCSRNCADDAWKQYHRFECPLLQLIVDTGLGHLAYRIVAYTGYNTLKDYKDGRTTEAAMEYTPVHQLVTNAESINETDLQYYMKAALLLVMILRKLQYFPPSIQTLDDPEVLTVGVTLLHHVTQLICNAHAITYLEDTPAQSAVVTREQVNIASAIYPTTSLLNHSCKPNVSVSFHGEHVVVKSQGAIKPGEEIFNCYGPHYMKMSVQDRRAALQQQYHFYCQCIACEKDDSKSTEIFSCPEACGFPAAAHTNSIIRCTRCASASASTSYFRAEQLALQALNANEKPSAQVVLLKAALGRKELYEVGILKARLYDKLSLQYSLLGKPKLCAETAEKAVHILMKNYGEDAIEMAEEYHKIATIHSQAGNLKKTAEYAFKAQPIYKRFYHSSHENVREIDALCEQLTKLEPTKINL